MTLRATTLFLLAALAVLPRPVLGQDDLGDPGPEHKLLAKLAGNWDAKMKVWFEPGKPPTESNGTMKRKLILGGRYLHEEFEAKLGDEPFSGLGIVGFDRGRKKYVTTWVDSMSTSVLLSEGTYDADKKTFIYLNDDADPATGKKMKGRDLLRFDTDDQTTFEMYRTPEGGKEFKALEIVYTRRKKE